MTPLDSPSAGGKANGLARLLAAGAKVPPAIALGAEAFDVHCAGRDRAAILEAPLDASLLDGFSLSFPVAVRSSALDEDGADASFAGQHDTVLGVTTRAELEQAIKTCWASAFSDRAVAYRAHVGARPPRMAVVIQAFIEPRAAGVVFTQSPSGKTNTLVIEAVKGRGEELVSGRATPERFEVKRSDAAVIGGQVLTLDEVKRLMAEALELETRLGGEPLDLEWAIGADGTLFWLQARPITTALSQDDSSLVWSNTNAGELLPDVATPMTLELVKGIVTSLFSVFTADLGIDWEKTPVVGLVGGRIYFSMNAFSALAATVPGMSKRSPAELFGGHADEIVAGLEKVKASKEPLVRGAGLALLKGFARLMWRMFRQRHVDPARDVAIIYAETERLSRFDLRVASDEALLEHLHVLNGGLGTQFHDVFAAIAVGMGCTNALMANCRKWLGDADGSKASALLAGLGGLDSAESALELWKLGESLRAAGLGELIARREWPAMRAALSGQPELEKKWTAWMSRHGHHARAELDVAQPRWRETPEVVLGLLAAQSPLLGGPALDSAQAPNAAQGNAARAPSVAHGNAVQGNAVQGNAAQGNAVQGNAVQGNAVQGHAVQGHAAQANAVQANAVQANAAQAPNAVQGNAAQANAVQAPNAAEGNAVQGNAAPGNAAQANAAQANAAQANAAQANAAQANAVHGPTPVLVAASAPHDAPGAARGPLEVFAAAARRREETEADALKKLGPLQRSAFRFLLARARRGTRLRENLKSESVRRLAMVRETLLELGARLVKRNVLERDDDVFFLELAELKPALAPHAPSLQRKVARARAEHRKWTPLTPPPVVVGRLDPTTALPPPIPDATILKGLAVSGGVLEGIARVVLRSDQETRVAPGEVLVAPFTDPGWAPYFVAAGALVVDLGGMLSHGSIIAREYGIPAVVNVGHATRRIKSGSRIRVDGFRGEVTILSEPDA